MGIEAPLPKLLVIQAREGQDIVAEQIKIRRITGRISRNTFVSPRTHRWQSADQLLEGIQGTLWLGSPFNIPKLDTEQEQPGLYDHLRRAVPLAREVIEREIPTMGICFGHQTLAYAASGVVRNLRGEEGIRGITLTKAGETEPVLTGLPNPLRMSFSHEDSVTQLPDGAVVLGKTDRDPHSVIRYRSVLSLQGHPERGGPDKAEQIIVNFLKNLK